MWYVSPLTWSASGLSNQCLTSVSVQVLYLCELQKAWVFHFLRESEWYLHVFIASLSKCSRLCWPCALWPEWLSSVFWDILVLFCLCGLLSVSWVTLLSFSSFPSLSACPFSSPYLSVWRWLDLPVWWWVRAMRTDTLPCSWQEWLASRPSGSSTPQAFLLLLVQEVHCVLVSGILNHGRVLVSSLPFAVPIVMQVLFFILFIKCLV